MRIWPFSANMEVKTCKQKIIYKNVTVSFRKCWPHSQTIQFSHITNWKWEWPENEALGQNPRALDICSLPTDLVAAWVLALVLVHCLLGLGRVGRIDNGEVLIIAGWGSRGKWVGRLWRRRLGSEPLLWCLQFLCFLRFAGKQVERRRLIFSRARRACVRVNMRVLICQDLQRNEGRESVGWSTHPHTHTHTLNPNSPIP